MQVSGVWDMNEEFLRERAKMVRDLADKADPHTKRRLLDLADRYEKKPRPPTQLPALSATTTKEAAN
jgi:hypothetical protein